MSDLMLTESALRHAQRNGVPLGLLKTVLHYADLETSIGHGQAVIRLSFEALRRLRDECAASVAERAKNVILVVTDRAVVTVFHAGNGVWRKRLSEHR